jgi:hypothetical protein
MHIETVRKLGAALRYCRKQFTKAGPTLVFGTLPKVEGSSLVSALDYLRLGKMTLEAFIADHPVEFIKYAGGIVRFHSLWEGQRSLPTKSKPTCYWVSGFPGCGKTSFVDVKTLGMKKYEVCGNMEFFCGLDTSHEVILIDEIDKMKVNVETFLKLLDNRECLLKVKGSVTRFNPQQVWLLSNKRLSEVFVGDDYGAVKRRVKIIEVLGEENGEERVSFCGVDAELQNSFITHLKFVKREIINRAQIERAEEIIRFRYD